MIQAIANTGAFVLNAVFGIYIGIILLRFFMQWARVNFSNPFAKFVVKASNPLLIPLRRIVPSLSSYDTASIVLAFLLHIAFILILSFLNGQGTNIVRLVLWSLTGLITITLSMYVYIIIGSVIASWVPDLQHQPVMRMLRQLSEPVLAPFRRLIPDIGGIDISPIIPFFLVQAIKTFLYSVPVLQSVYILGL